MLQYVIIAHDGKDEEAPARRNTTRPIHLAGAKKLKDNNNFLLGGAMLNDQGNMIGSIMIVQFETEEEMKSWFSQEPYVTGGVWRVIDVKPFRVADV